MIDPIAPLWTTSLPRTGGAADTGVAEEESQADDHRMTSLIHTLGTHPMPSRAPRFRLSTTAACLAFLLAGAAPLAALRHGGRV